MSVKAQPNVLGLLPSASVVLMDRTSCRINSVVKCVVSCELTRLTQENSTRAQLDVYCRDRTYKEDQIKRL